MSDPLTIVIPGKPVAQGRGRAVPTPRGIRVKDPERARSWKAVASWHMQQAMLSEGQSVAEGPLTVSIVARWKLPTGEARKRSPVPEQWRPKGEDADNVAKAVLDAGNGILWLDDSQVVDLRVSKLTAAQGAPPSVTMIVRKASEPADEP